MEFTLALEFTFSSQLFLTLYCTLVNDATPTPTNVHILYDRIKNKNPVPTTAS